MRRLLALLILLLPAGPAAAQSVVKTDNVRAELISEVSEVKAGEPFWVALRQTIRPHWHTYWKNPGDSGLPTEISWTLPAGVKADPIVWPTPTLIDVSGVTNYGFQDDILLLVKITPPTDLAGNTLALVANANWLVCDDVCIPEDGKFTLTLPAGPAARHRPVGRSDADRRGQGPEARHDPRCLFLPCRMGRRGQHGQANGERHFRRDPNPVEER
jgi:DsbC/DsbD-like thiol-disulfide interchange protein